MINNPKKIIAAVLLIVGLILVNMISSWVSLQADFTEEKLYTLSEGSISLLEKIEEPITLTYYFSRSNESLGIYVKNYALRVEDLLNQYVEAANGNIELKIIDPKPDSDEEELALRSGINGQRIGNGSSLFFG